MALGLSVALVLPGFLLGSLAVRMREDFPLDASALGLGLALFYGVSAASSPVAGRLVGRIGAARGMRIASVLGALSALGIALLAGSVWALFGLLLLSGLAKAIGSPGTAAMLAHDMADDRRGFAFGLQQSAAPLGALMAGLALPLIALPFGWRWAFAAAAALTLAGGAAVPRRHIGAGRDPAAESAGRGRRIRPVHVIALATAFASAASVGMVTFLVVYAVDEGMSAVQAGALLVVSSLTAIATRVGLGTLADRRRREVLGPTAALLTLCAAGFVLLATGSLALIVLGTLIAGGIGRGWNGLASLAVVVQNPGSPAEAFGAQMSGFWVGAMVGPLLVGVLAEVAGFAASWLACAVLMLLAAATILAAREFEGRPTPAG